MTCSEVDVAGRAGYQMSVRSACVAAPRQLYDPRGTNLRVAAPTGHAPGRLWPAAVATVTVTTTNRAAKFRPTLLSYGLRRCRDSLERCRT